MPLFSGPFKLNACPLRRINEIYVIATKTKLDISKVELPKLSDGYFKRRHPKRKKKDEGEIFETKKEVAASVLVIGLRFFEGFITCGFFPRFIRFRIEESKTKSK